MNSVDKFISTTYSFQDRAPVYVFTNENIADYLRPIGDLTGKNVLTVAASGDHAFLSYLAGAKSVDTFDINSFQNSIIELKTHMIKHLSYNDFLTFFFDEKRFFDTKILEPISDKFSKKLISFIEDYKIRGLDMIRYRAACSPDYRLLQSIPYLYSSDKYYKLRERLPEKINFKHCNLLDVHNRFNKKYDLILLSNIFEYLYMNYNMMSYEQRIEKYYKDVLSKLADKNLCGNNSQIIFSYMWGTNPNAWISYIDYFNKKHSLYSNRAFERNFVARATESMQKNCKWDVVLSMTQKQL